MAADVQGIIREAAAACEAARRYGCTIEVTVSAGGLPPGQAVHVTVTPEGWPELTEAATRADD